MSQLLLRQCFAHLGLLTWVWGSYLEHERPQGILTEFSFRVKSNIINIPGAHSPSMASVMWSSPASSEAGGQAFSPGILKGWTTCARPCS